MIWVLAWLGLLAFAILLAFPARAKGGLGWVRRLSVVIGGVVVPLTIFFFSQPFLMPGWKGAARCGVFDGFHTGKFALTPIVLFATAALYWLEVIRSDAARSRWVILGVYSGAVTSFLCQVFAFSCLDLADYGLVLLLAVCYIPVWYGLRTVQLIETSMLPAFDYIWMTLGMAPFWGLSWSWSRDAFEALPETPPNCFVVTAAGRGHRSLVGPFFEIEHRGGRRIANRQLYTFWQFEAVWRRRSPGTLREFRRRYDRFGPLMAARITSRWQADVVFVALKPLECLARVACRISLRSAETWR